MPIAPKAFAALEATIAEAKPEFRTVVLADFVAEHLAQLAAIAGRHGLGSLAQPMSEAQTALETLAAGERSRAAGGGWDYLTRVKDAVAAAKLGGESSAAIARGLSAIEAGLRKNSPTPPEPVAAPGFDYLSRIWGLIETAKRFGRTNGEIVGELSALASAI